MLPTKRIRMLFSNYIVLRVFLINNTVLFDDKMVYLAKMNLERSFVMRKALICASVLSMLISSKAIASEMDLSEINETGKTDVSYSISEGLEFKSNGDGTCSITGIGTCTDTELVIPNQSPEGDEVTLIEENAFMSLENVESVTLIDADYKVGRQAFRYGEFDEINIIGGNPAIQDWAFSNCHKITQILIKNCDIKMAENAFCECGENFSVYIENCTGSIGLRAFWLGEMIKLTISSSELKIEEDAFSNCKDLKNILITDSKIETEKSAFYICGNEANVEIRNSNVNLGEVAFQYSSISSLLITGEEIEIGDGTFSACNDLSTVVIDGDNTTIQEHAFISCENLASVFICDNEVMNNNIKIGETSFRYCEKLESIIIGNGNISIGDDAFYGCSDDLIISVSGASYTAESINNGIFS